MSLVLGDLLAMIRQDYMDTLAAAYAEAITHGPAALEPALGAPMISRDAWGDMKVGARLVSVPSEGVFGFQQPICFGWGDALPGQAEPLQVEVWPFAWDDLRVSLQVAAGRALDDTPLAQWLEQWATPPADVVGKEPSDELGRGVVHGLAAGQAPDTWHADLGTAPLEAWQDLLEAALAANAVRMIVGQKR
jgi:hypothetical protein